MATTKVTDRQAPITAVLDLGISNLGTGNGKTFNLPPNALLLRMILLTITAFDSVTTSTATVGDGTVVFANGVDTKSVGSETIANTPKFYPTGGTITASLAETGATATVGRAVLVAEYIIVGRGIDQQF